MHGLDKIIDHAIAAAETFALVVLPGEESPLFFGRGLSAIRYDKAYNISDNFKFEIIPWLGKFADRIIFESNTVVNLDNAGVAENIPTLSTTKSNYIESVENAIRSCAKRKGKTVISRIICGNFQNNSLSIGQIAIEVFKIYPFTFRYLFYSPSTGGWLGATPEILADLNYDDQILTTMALAGTRQKQENPTLWDNKNITENQFVVNFIESQLNNVGLSPTISAPESLSYGNIEHLCRRIQCNAPSELLPQIIDVLNPTPALCGTPRDKAIMDISNFEGHDRNLYGGVVALSSNNRYQAFVNLRCMQFTRQKYCIYAGGGITAESLPETEYEETQQKSAVLQHLTSISSL